MQTMHAFDEWQKERKLRGRHHLNDNCRLRNIHLKSNHNAKGIMEKRRDSERTRNENVIHYYLIVTEHVLKCHAEKP